MCTGRPGVGLIHVGILGVVSTNEEDECTEGVLFDFTAWGQLWSVLLFLYLFAPTCPSLLLQREYSGISSVLVGLVLEVRLIRDMTDLGKPIHCILQEKYGFRFRSSDTLAI